MIYDSVIEMVGGTPLLRLHKIEKAYDVDCKIYAKLEKQNPAGSVKDRVALSMYLDYIEKGLLKKDTVIIEPTSGNTGIGLSSLGNYFGNKVIIVMPKSMSQQRRDLMKAYNAELVLVDGGMKEAVDKANELHKENKNSIIAGQFYNGANINAHFKHTAPEIFNDLNKVDYIFAGIGTGGTISGIGKYVKLNNLETKIIGVEPASSPLINKGYVGAHKIQGIGANFIPDNFKKDYVDEVVDVEDDEAINTAKNIVKQEGILVGISSGASLNGAIHYIKKESLHDKTIVVIMPDTGERYSWN